MKVFFNFKKRFFILKKENFRNNDFVNFVRDQFKNLLRRKLKIPVTLYTL